MSEPDLKYVISKFEIDNQRLTFELEIIDEYTINWFEQLYGNKYIQFDGRTFTFTHYGTIDFMQGMPEKNPAMWQQLHEKHPEVIHKYVLMRLKGEINGMD